MPENLTIPQTVDRANQLLDAGKLPEAESLYRQALTVEPNNASALHGLGLVALRTNNLAPAVQLMRKSIVAAPQVPRYRANLGLALRINKQLDESLRVLQETLRYFPSDIPTFREIGATLGEMKRYADSIAAYEQSLALSARLPQGIDEAMRKQADARVWINIGAMHAAMGNIDQAIAAHDRALELAPAHAVGHMNRGHLLFRKGRLREAFADYEWRWKVSDFTAQWVKYSQPKWDGSDLAGRSVLLWHEQGMGDTIQFARYAPMVAGRNGRAILLVQPPLKTLLQTLDPAVQIVSDDDPLPAFDVHLPILGLPQAFGTERNTIPSSGGYLKADPSLVETWKARLRVGEVAGKEPLLRVGLVWSGSTGFIDNQNRSMPLAAMSPLLRLKGIRFYSLQKGEPAKQLTGTPLPAPVADLSPHLTDFAQTAAALKALDLFITVDTGPAHLAGAIAAPVWTMLCFEPDFRWLWDRDQSSWYDSMRLFQQPAPGDWTTVIGRVEAELKKKIESVKTPQAAEIESQPTAVSPTNAIDVAGILAKTHTLLSRQNPNPAIALLTEAMREAPNDFYLRREYALALKLAGRNVEAVEEYQRALDLHASQQTQESERTRWLADAEVYSNLGVALTDLGRHDEALAATDNALALDPQNPRYHLNRVSMRMRRGDIPGAFEDYEFRWRDGTMPWPDFPQPLWDGSDLAGKTILLWHEQGFGDTIQFARFIPLVAARGGKVLVRCQPPLLRLFNDQKRGRTHYLNMCVPFFFGEGDVLPAFDVHAPLMSLPRILGTTLENLPAPQRYLAAAEEDAHAWKRRLENEPGGGQTPALRVGIVSAGSVLHRNDKNRSLPPEAFAPLMSLSNVRFYSLQKGAAGEQMVKMYRDRVVDFTANLKDFADTAALIENLDLIISVDTAAAHLAGALGKRVWLLLPHEPEFRWLFEDRQSRWYPSMTIYRQARAGDWPGTIAEVERDLRELVGDAPPRGATDAALTDILRSAHQLHGAGQLQEAEQQYRQVLERQPDNASAMHHLGLIAFRNGQLDRAVELMQQSLALDSSQAFFFKNFATVCRQAGMNEKSAQMLQKAIELNPGDSTMLEELGVTLEKLDRLDESISAYQQAIQLLKVNGPSPALKDAATRNSFEAKLHSNLGAALERKNDYEAAMPHFEHAIRAKPDYGMAHMHRANVLFRRRDLPAAFEEYEWRFRTKGFPTAWRSYPQKTWDGSDLSGQAILLWPEQGLGDVLQYARFAPILAQRGAKVILQSMPQLARVLRTLAGEIRVITTDENPPAFDFHLPLISVPRVLRTTFESLPAPRSYLSPDPALKTEWVSRMDEAQRRVRTADHPLPARREGAPQFGPYRRIGIVWSGSPSFGLNHRRSIPLQTLAPLFNVKEIDWFSLQMGPAAADLAKTAFPASMIDLSDRITDFADSAAILANLDLLISTDTAIVHLAGALGVPTWVMLWSERDFRWLMDDRSMPWYPSVRPFLQSTAGNWEDVIEKIAAELRDLNAQR